MRNNGLFLGSLVIVTTILVISIIIFGFDINTPQKTGDALADVLQNKSKTNYFFKINDTYAFGVFTDRPEGEYDVIITPYTRNYIPFCFFCGWYTGDPDNDNYINQPYQIGNMYYSTRANDEDYAGVPKGGYPTFDMSTSKFSYVTDLNTLGANPTDSTKKVSRKMVAEKHSEISYSSSDDEDCQIVFAALTVCYIVLALWGIILLIRKKK